MKYFRLMYICAIFFGLPLENLWPATNEDCLMCHSDPELTAERRGRTISLFVDAKKYGLSVHREQDCISCPPDADVEEFPHPERLELVNCGNCHRDADEEFYC